MSSITDMGRRSFRIILLLSITSLLSSCEAYYAFNAAPAAVEVASAILKDSEPADSASTASYQENTDESLCVAAVDPMSKPPQWYSGYYPRRAVFIREAERRGLTPESCSALLERAVPTAPKNTPKSIEPATKSITKPRGWESRPFAVQWTGIRELIAGEISIWRERRNGKRRGKIRLTMPKAGGNCDGSYELIDGPKGTWQISCDNGLTATGTLVAYGAGKGSGGEGTDNLGRVIKFTVGGRHRFGERKPVGPAPVEVVRPKSPDPDLIKRIQRDLSELGLDPGPADGVLGSKTRSAIETFEAYVGLPVTGEPSEKLHSAIQASLGLIARQQQTKRQRQLRLVSSGTGFAISANNLFVTNFHVVKGCTVVRVQSKDVSIEASDPESDLALLRVLAKAITFVSLRGGRGVRPGEDIIVVGFPLQHVLSSDLNVTTGNVSALAGPFDDRRLIQITAPVQPGNSGGPVLDEAGNVVGVVVTKLDEFKELTKSGSLPQNVNFAISEGTVRAFLDAHNVQYELAPSTERLQTADVVAKAQKYVKRVECWK